MTKTRTYTITYTHIARNCGARDECNHISIWILWFEQIHRLSHSIPDMCEFSNKFSRLRFILIVAKSNVVIRHYSRVNSCKHICGHGNRDGFYFLSLPFRSCHQCFLVEWVDAMQNSVCVCVVVLGSKPTERD